MMRVCFLIALALFHFSAQAEAVQEWRWFLSGFCSPALDAALCTRAGQAQVRLEKSHVHITLTDPKIPEADLVFQGRIGARGAVAGALRGLSVHEPLEDSYQGAYRTLQMGKNCKAEQMVLMPEVPDGSVLSLSRVQGTCQ